MLESDHGDDQSQQDEREQGVGKEPEGIADEVADGFVLRSVWSVDHGGRSAS